MIITANYCGIKQKNDTSLTRLFKHETGEVTGIMHLIPNDFISQSNACILRFKVSFVKEIKHNSRKFCKRKHWQFLHCSRHFLMIKTWSILREATSLDVFFNGLSFIRNNTFQYIWTNRTKYKIKKIVINPRI